MLKGFSLFYGVFFIIFGIVGFLPFLVHEGFLFSTFKVNSATNLIHLLTGAVAGGVCFAQSYYQRLYFQIIGFIYAILSVFGFIYGKMPVLGFIANNLPMTWIHVIFSVLALILGFGANNTLDKRKGHE